MHCNQQLLNWEWVMVRLSEAQVIKYPASCCKIIASVISTIAGNRKMMRSDEIISPGAYLKLERYWSYEEVQQMIEPREQAKYLIAINSLQANAISQKWQK